jgi:hypothetical protein
VPPEIFRCAAKFLKILQFARDFEKLGENFKNFPYKVCREKIFYFLVCREPKKVEKHWSKTSKLRFKRLKPFIKIPPEN